MWQASIGKCKKINGQLVHTILPNLSFPTVVPTLLSGHMWLDVGCQDMSQVARGHFLRRQHTKFSISWQWPYGQNPKSNKALCNQQSTSGADMRQQVFCQTANLPVMGNQHNRCNLSFGESSNPLHNYDWQDWAVSAIFCHILIHQVL
jgi:hypothetical protein